MEMSDYEELRLRNIERNAAKLAELALAGENSHALLPANRAKAAPRKRSKRGAAAGTAAPARRSLRAAQQPPAVYSADHAEDDRAELAAQRRAQQQSGHRLADGRWRGERYGPVRGVAVGTVFGAGDYQRKGRFEMSETGFHAGHVQPEWLDPSGAGCWSLVLNNDNGQSDFSSFETVAYAGAGGRNRGQNRTAAQSYDQSWDSAVNRALRANCENGRPVRVVRGPKLPGPHSTATSGGGFRYDGLYGVTKAEMVRTGPKHLQTCMFTLQRLESPCGDEAEDAKKKRGTATGTGRDAPGVRGKRSRKR